MLIYVQFYDDTEAVVAAYWSTPQDPQYYPNQGSMDTSDPRWHAYYDSLDPFFQASLPTPD